MDPSTNQSCFTLHTSDAFETHLETYSKNNPGFVQFYTAKPNSKAGIWLFVWHFIAFAMAHAIVIMANG